MSQFCPSCAALLPAGSGAAGEFVRCWQCGMLSELKAGFGQAANYPPPPAPYQQQVPAGFGPPPGTPFQPQVPNQFSDQFSPQNPYQNFYPPGYYNYVDRNRALSKAFGPAIFMQVYSGLIVLCGLGLAVMIPLVIDKVDKDEQPFFVAVFGVGVFLCLALGGFTFFAGMRFRILRSYGLVMTVVIGTLVIGFLACLPAMLLAVWPMVVLMDSEVKACFDQPEGHKQG